MSQRDIFKTLEGKPFLSIQNGDTRFSTPSNADQSPVPHSRRYGIIFIQVALIVFYTAVSAVAIQLKEESCAQSSNCEGPFQSRRLLLISSSVLDNMSLKYATKQFMKMRESPYVGRPSQEVDQAWGDLMGNMSIRVTKAELDRNDQTSVELPQGGYLAWLGVFHQLHCVVSSRRPDMWDD